MDQQQPAEPPMNGNDDLAKALDGGLQFEETPVAGDSTTPPPPPAADATDPAAAPDLTSLDPLADTATPAEDTPTEADDVPPTVHHGHSKKHPAAEGDLEDLKQSALEELRPLVGKLKLSPEERFDTLLLIIRSTDDKDLLAEAHEAAKSITDENRRAQALLDIVKEVDYFSSK